MRVDLSPLAGVFSLSLSLSLRLSRNTPQKFDGEPGLLVVSGDRLSECRKPTVLEPMGADLGDLSQVERTILKRLDSSLCTVRLSVQYTGSIVAQSPQGSIRKP